MRDNMAMTQNVRRFLAAIREAVDRPTQVEGMVTLWGEPGEGKSTTVAYVCNTMDGIFLRAMKTWTVTSMLAALCVEIGAPISRTRAPMMDAIIKRLSETQHPVFIDESDYLFQGGKIEILDVLRDIYDVSGAPVVLIGEEKLARKVQAIGKFARRITQWVEFCGIDIEDARTLANDLCEVDVADDLLDHVHTAARKNIGRMVTGLARIEKFGELNNLKTVTKREWAGRPLFYDQPRFAKRSH